jgi:glycosyltransferase involved in cell wall biosynthesis
MLGSNSLHHSSIKPANWVVYTPSRQAIVIATKNQSAAITSQVQQIIAAGNMVIVVDDGSTDGTPQTAEAAGAIVIRTDKTNLFASAIRQAVRLAASLSSQVLVMRG